MRTFSLIAIFICLQAFQSKAQISSRGWHRDLLDSLEWRYQSKGAKYHSVFQPQVPLLKASDFDPRDSVSRSLIVDAAPLLAARVGAGANGKALWSLAVGALIGIKDHQRWDGEISYTFNQFYGPSYLNRRTDSISVFPGVGKLEKNENFGYYFAHQFAGHMGYRAGDHFYFEVGNGKHFLGDGYRSLILSDNAPAYPYGKMVLDVWRVRFQSLFAQCVAEEEKKYFATHTLSWNVTDRFQMSFFEMVVWQAKDSLSNRNLDFHYLNPLLFYRPLEYTQGSADNVILGAGFKHRPTNQFHWYAQLVLDEFLLSELSNQTGWWANKFGGQIGFRYFNLLPGLSVQSEFNAVRPFTYSHGSEIQAWGHYNQALAHPLGANFWEWSTMLSYRLSDNYFITNKYLWSSYGRDMDMDNDGVVDNLGGDIFRSYVNPYQERENVLMQGNRSVLHFSELKIYRYIKKVPGMVCSVGYLGRLEKNQGIWQNDHYLLFSVSMSGLLETVTDY
jgi:hypothetical protein